MLLSALFSELQYTSSTGWSSSSRSSLVVSVRRNTWFWVRSSFQPKRSTAAQATANTARATAASSST